MSEQLCQVIINYLDITRSLTDVLTTNRLMTHLKVNYFRLIHTF